MQPRGWLLVGTFLALAVRGGLATTRSTVGLEGLSQGSISSASTAYSQRAYTEGTLQAGKDVPVQSAQEWQDATDKARSMKTFPESVASSSLDKAFDKAAAAAALLASKVRVDFYAESLCPYCARFTTGVLAGLFQSGLSELVDLQYVAWGNARNLSGTVECQHGAGECVGNRVINCATHLYPAQDEWFPFVECLEGHLGPDQEAAAKGCALQAGLDYARISDCYKGSLGDQLLVAAADKTAALKPAHQYVPWVVVNGIPLADDYENLPKYICTSTSTPTKPAACYADPACYACVLQPETAPKPRVTMRQTMVEQHPSALETWWSRLYNSLR